MSPKIAETKLNFSIPTNPQFSPPTITSIKDTKSKVLSLFINIYLLIINSTKLNLLCNCNIVLLIFNYQTAIIAPIAMNETSEATISKSQSFFSLPIQMTSIEEEVTRKPSHAQNAIPIPPTMFPMLL